MTFSDEQIQRARESSIHLLLGLQNNGRRISISCPFPDHEDGSPSFALYPDNTYHCFGCDKHGHNAVDFCRDLGIKFDEAIKGLTE